MADLIAWDMITLDGYFEGPEHDIDWFHFDDELERYIHETQLDAGALVFGRATYEMMAEYWPSAEGRIADFMNTVRKVVVSRTLDKPSWSNTTVVRDDVAGEVAKLKQQADGDIFVFGSADLTATLIRESLVDEYRLGINPVMLGGGVPFFKGGFDRRPLQLVSCRPLRSGVVILSYRPR